MGFCDSSLVLMISFCTGVDIMARYQLLNNNNKGMSHSVFYFLGIPGLYR